MNFVCLIGRKFDKAESRRPSPSTISHVGVVGIKGSAWQAARQKKCASLAGRQTNGRTDGRRRWLEIKAEVKVESTLQSVRQLTAQPKAIQVNYAANVENY